MFHLLQKHIASLEITMSPEITISSEILYYVTHSLQIILKDKYMTLNASIVV